MYSGTSCKYRAFLSYSHKNTRWAKWLHTRLERFKIEKGLVGRETPMGPIPVSLRPIFRDRDEFLAGKPLKTQTLEAIDDSEALIVICSPAAAKSQYVNEEVRLFKSRHSNRPVVPVIVDGQPGNAEQECFPPALRYAIAPDGVVTSTAEELVAADVRREGDGPELALAKVIASLIGLGTDDVFRRLERQQRRRWQIQLAAGLMLLSALNVAGISAWSSYQRGRTLAEIENLVRRYDPGGDTARERRQELTRAIRAIAEGTDPRYPRALALLKEGKPRQAEPILQSIAEDTAARVTKTQKDAAKAYRHLGAIAGLSDPKRAREYYKQALAYDPADRETIYWTGFLALLAGDLRVAETKFMELQSLSQKDGSEEDLYRARLRLGEVYLGRGNSSKALSEQKGAFTLAEILLAKNARNPEFERNLAISQEKIGDLLKSQGNSSAALDYYRASLAIVEHIASDHPNSSSFQADMSIAQDKIGEALQAVANFEGALQSFITSLHIRERLASADSEAPGWQRYLSVSHERVGDVLQATGDLPNALAHYTASLNIREALTNSDPDNFMWIRDLSVAYEKVGENFRACGDLAGALKQYEQSLFLRRRLVEIDAENAIWQRDLSVSLNKIGDILQEQNKPDDAIERYTDALRVREMFSKQYPENMSMQADLAASYARLAKTALAIGDKYSALRWFKLGLAVIVPIAEGSSEKLWADYKSSFEADISALEIAGIK